MENNLNNILNNLDIIYEIKSENIFNKKEIIKVIVSFLNDFNLHNNLVYNLNDKAILIRLDIIDNILKKLMSLKKSLIKSIDESIFPRAWLNVDIYNDSNENFIIIKILDNQYFKFNKQQYRFVFYKFIFNNGIYLRDNNEITLKNPFILYNLTENSTNLIDYEFDNVESTYNAEDYSFNKFVEFFNKHNRTKFKSIFLKSFNMVTSNNLLTYAGALFVDNPPIFSLKLICRLWLGLEKNSPYEFLIDSLESYGNLIDVFETALNFLKQYNKTSSKGLNIKRKVFDYNMEVIREVVGNAIIHRNYLNDEIPIEIDIFSNRIVVTNPAIDFVNENGQFKIFRRNFFIAEIFYRLKLIKPDFNIEKIIDLSNDYLSLNNNYQPIFSLKHNQFKVTIFNSNQNFKNIEF